MGNNDSLPPPPPPGGQRDLPPTQATPVPPPPPGAGFPGASGMPAPPPAPPAVPQFPDAAPTTQMPPTQAYPMSTPAGAGAVPPGAPPPTGVPPASGGNNKLPWIIAGAVTVVSVIVVAIVLLTGDDKTSSSPTTDSVAVSTTVVASTTVVPQTTLVITTPSTTLAAPTTAPTTPDTSEPGVSVFTDDTNTFTVLLLDTFETDTTPIDQDGTQIANVTGATDIEAFSQDDDHDTFGISVSAGPSDQMPSAAELLASADPGDTVCTDRTSKPGYPTLNGNAEVLLLDGCGTDGQFAKVVMVLTFPDRNLTLAVYAQGPGPSNTDLLDFTQAVTESVVFL